MKKLVYKIEGYTGLYNAETEEVEQILSLADVIIENPTDEDVERAKEVAHNGEYTIEDDGVEETHEPTDKERIAELEEALAMLLNGVTE